MYKMNGKFILVLILSISLVCLFSTRLGQFEAWARNAYPVHNLDTGLNYTTIQEAINANETQDFQTIFVDAGKYYENIVVNKSVSIIGENKWTTIIDGNNKGDAVYIESKNVQISGFTITNDLNNIVIGSNWFLTLPPHTYFPVTGVVIRDNLICNATWGVYINTGSGNNRIEGNIIQSHLDYGIMLMASSDNVIVDNTVMNNHGGIGCIQSKDRALDWWVPSQNNTVYQNNFVQNTPQAVSESVWSSMNIWDNGAIGNYWSDYQTRYPNATQANGIWNTSYEIDAYNIDHYPLVDQIIIPEFTPVLIMPLFMIAALLAVIVYRRKRTR
jgi:parallel beta-helix repeat protein